MSSQEDGRTPSPVSITVRRLPGGMVAALGGVVSLATLAGCLGSWWWPLDLAANFRPQYAVLLVVLAPAALALRYRRTAVALALVALVNLALVWPYLSGVRLGPPDDAPRLAVVSFNVGISNPQRAEVMEYLRFEDPDVVFLFESSFEWEDAVRSSGLPLSLLVVVPDGQVAGITMLVRQERDPTRVGVPFPGREAAAVSLSLGEQRVEVLGLHPPSPTAGSRAAERDRLLAAAGDWAAGRPGPVVIVGDFNATPWSHAHRSLRERGGLTDTLRTAGLMPTWPSGFGPLMIPIDHALITPDLATAARRTGPSHGSAHRPLLVIVGAAAGSG